MLPWLIAKEPSASARHATQTDFLTDIIVLTDFDAPLPGGVSVGRVIMGG
jgi:hypothetical protein